MAEWKELVAYLSHRDCGSSATAMIHRFNNISGKLADHPHDPSDFERCIKLLKRFPEYRLLLPRMTDVSPEWALLIEHWDELEAMFHQEAYSQMYERMRSLFNSIPCVLCGNPLNGTWTALEGNRYHFDCFDKRDVNES